MAAVYIPTIMRELTGGRPLLNVQGRTVGDVIDALHAEFPRLRASLCDGDGRIKSFIAIFVNETDVRDLEGTDTPITERDEVQIIPAIAGG